MSLPNDNNLSDYLRRERDKWAFRGSHRPPFAKEPGVGQESVWDYPRPPSLIPSTRHVVIKTPDGTQTIADTTKALKMCETASPPTWYVPWTDVKVDLLSQAGAAHNSFCEWKGAARYWKLAKTGRSGEIVGWDYPNPLEGGGYGQIANMGAFYAGRLQCFVDGERVRPQPGSFYGGWITNDVVGPFKGEGNTRGW